MLVNSSSSKHFFKLPEILVKRQCKKQVLCNIKHKCQKAIKCCLKTKHLLLHNTLQSPNSSLYFCKYSVTCHELNLLFCCPTLKCIVDQSPNYDALALFIELWWWDRLNFHPVSPGCWASSLDESPAPAVQNWPLALACLPISAGEI